MATNEEIQEVLDNHKDFYGILSIDKNATESQVKRGYRLRALKFHPDKNPGSPRATEAFKALTRANEVLMDADKRTIYDREGFDGLRSYEDGGGEPTLGMIALGVLYYFARKWETFGPVREYEHAEDANTTKGRDRIEEALRAEMKLMGIYGLMVFLMALLGILLGGLSSSSADTGMSGVGGGKYQFFAESKNNGGFVSLAPHPECPFKHSVEVDLEALKTNEAAREDGKKSKKKSPKKPAMTFYSSFRDAQAARQSAQDVDATKQWTHRMATLCQEELSLSTASQKRHKKQSYNFVVDPSYNRPNGEKRKFRDDASVTNAADVFQVSRGCAQFLKKSGFMV